MELVSVPLTQETGRRLVIVSLATVAMSNPELPSLQFYIADGPRGDECKLI